MQLDLPLVAEVRMRITLLVMENRRTQDLILENNHVRNRIVQVRQD